MEISQKIVAFSEYMNFKKVDVLLGLVFWFSRAYNLNTNILRQVLFFFIISWIIGIQKRGMQDLNSKFCLIFLVTDCIQFNDTNLEWWDFDT